MTTKVAIVVGLALILGAVIVQIIAGSIQPEDRDCSMWTGADYYMCESS